MEHDFNRSLHVVQAADWKDAVITFLEPRSPYQPWRAGTDVADEGDTVAYVLNTDPASVLTEVARVGADRDPLAATFERPLYKPTLIELSTVAVLVGLDLQISDEWHFHGDDAVKLELALDEGRFISPPASRFGHNTMAAARTMLQYRGWCEGCLEPIDLTRTDARDRIFAHTVESYTRPEPSEFRYCRAEDWSAVICRGCRDRMRDEGFTDFVEFKFALHPPCPQCGARRTRATFYGEPAEPWNIRPWEHAAGCCRSEEEWFCDLCDHRW